MENQQEIILKTLEILLEIQLSSVKKALGKDVSKSNIIRRKSVKRKSMIEYCVQILTGEQGPLHVDKLVNILEERFGRVTDRDPLSSALAKKAKQGLLVRRVSPAMFEILS
ncbi:MAG: hypothetical protein E2O83_08995 [Bacteroidetes bacterium]|nr:MAG: hypothetical protein E2O83_08995 [Bacteroidota bacterium]